MLRFAGFPIIMKASAGGGGMGMQVAWSIDEVASKFRDAKSEAMSSFGECKRRRLCVLFVT
jgi:acetyl/propionyl-CoA carboxylase alpha subunit